MNAGTKAAMGGMWLAKASSGTLKLINKALTIVVGGSMAIVIGIFAYNLSNGHVPSDLRTTSEFKEAKAYVLNKIDEKIQKDLAHRKDQPQTLAGYKEIEKKFHASEDRNPFDQKPIKMIGYTTGLTSLFIGLFILVAVAPLAAAIAYLGITILGLFNGSSKILNQIRSSMD